MIALLITVALAGDVYVNGVDVGDMSNQTFEDATVFFDSSGDIHISAPGYQLEVLDDRGRPVPPVLPPAPAVVPGVAPEPVAQPVVAPPTPAPDLGVAAGHWWLVTEDSGTTGHAVNVRVNGVVVQTVQSGQAQLIYDLGPYLRHGDNSVAMEANSINPTGGTLYLYVGTGGNESGTVMMDTPSIQFGLGTSRQGPYSREYTLQVP